MQTALSVREVVMKVLDVFVFVAVYFISALVLVASADPWLMVPFILWAAVYGFILRWCVPRLGKIAEARASFDRAVKTMKERDLSTELLDGAISVANGDALREPSREPA